MSPDTVNIYSILLHIKLVMVICVITVVDVA